MGSEPRIEPPSPTAHRGPPPKGTSRRLGTALFVVGTLAFAAVIGARPLSDADLGWHLAEAREMAATRALPSVDSFAYTHRPVLRVDAIGDLLLYAAVRLGGPLGLQIAGALVAMGIAFASLALMRRHEPLARALVALAMAGLSSWLLVRPVMFSFLFFPLLLWLLDTHRSAPASPSGRRALIGLPLLLIVWSNTHGFAILGAAIALAYAGCRVCARLARGRLPALFPPKDAEGAWPSAATITASVLAMTISPGGPRAFFGGPFRIMDDKARVTEWMSTDAAFFYATEQAAGLVLLVTLVALFVGREPDGKRCPPLFDLTVVALALLLERTSVRFVPVAILLSTPFAARRLSSFVRATPIMEVTTGLAMLLVAPVVLIRPRTELGVGFDRRFQPEGAVEYILASRPSGHMWNFSPYGGYLTWRLYPDYLVLMDGRTSWVHDPQLTARVHESNFDVATFQGLVKEFDLEWAISRAGPEEQLGIPLARLAGWTMVYVDDYSAVYVRKDGPNRALADAGYQVLNHLIVPERVLELAMSPATDPRALTHDAALAVQQDPTSARAAVIQASAAVSARDEAGFHAAIDRLQILKPGNAAIDALAQAWAWAAAHPRARPASP